MEDRDVIRIRTEIEWFVAGHSNFQPVKNL